MSSLLKAVAPAIIDAAAGAVKGKGVMTDIFKSVAPAAIDAIANAATSAAKNKVSGMGAKRKPGRP